MRWRRSDTVAIVAAVGLIAVAAVVGVWLNRRGVELVLPAPPLIARWSPHVGWGTPLVIGCVVAGLALQRRVQRWAWRRVLLVGWLLTLAWMVSLTLVDGFGDGWVDVLLDPNEYLEDVPRITDPAAFVHSFTHYIAFGGDVDGTNVWTTHVAGHPPLITLVFWLLDHVGLAGGFWAGLVCILLGSLITIAVPLTLADLGAETAARRLVPFLALFPGAVWMAVSADGLFAGVAALGLACSVHGATRRGRATGIGLGLLGGLLLGSLIFLSYGLVLAGVTVVMTLVITARAHGLRTIAAAWIAVIVGALAVYGTFVALGFSWFGGLAALHTRYYQGIASGRPFGYFVWANVAAWLVSCSPVLAVLVVRAVSAVRRGTTEDRVVGLVALSGVLAAAIADLSALSKAETERIWLTFGVFAYTAAGLLRGRLAAVLLVLAAASAITVNHLLDTGW